jgi:glutathione peroxidase-family protein
METPAKIKTSGLERKPSFHGLSAESPKGEQQLDKYAGQVTLIVNLASK